MHLKALVLDGVVDHSVDSPTSVALNVRSVDDELASAHPELVPVISQLLAAGDDPSRNTAGRRWRKMLAAAKAGDTSGFEKIRKATSLSGGEGDPHVLAAKSGLFTGVVCADYGPASDYGALVAGGRAISNEARRFAWKYWDYTPTLRASVGVGDCVGWPMAAGNPPHRLRLGLHPNVMVANPTHDSATPLANAMSVWLQIPQARLLVADSDGHQSWIVSKCDFEAEARFLGDPRDYPSVTLCPLEPSL